MIAIGVILILVGVLSILDGLLDLIVRLGCGLVVLAIIFGLIGSCSEMLQ